MAAILGADGQCISQVGDCVHQLSDSGVDASLPRIAADGGRQWAVAVWEQAYADVFAAVLHDGFWSFPQEIQSQAYTRAPEVALDGRGRAHVLFHTSATGLSTSVIGTAYRNELDSDWTVTPSLGVYGYNSAPQLTVEEGGSAFAVWIQSATEENATLGSVHVARYTTTTNQWQLEPTALDQDARLPSIGVDASGRAIAVWLHGGAVTVDRYE
jgi:hypothetical protein